MAQQLPVYKNRKVSIFARLHVNGKQITVPVERVGNTGIKPIPDAVYWIRWTHHDKQKY